MHVFSPVISDYLIAATSRPFFPTAMEGLQFILLDLSPVLVAEWQSAISQHIPEKYRGKFSIVQSKLSKLPIVHNQFDCIVSPANSYGLLDGG